MPFDYVTSLGYDRASLADVYLCICVYVSVLTVMVLQQGFPPLRRELLQQRSGCKVTVNGCGEGRADFMHDMMLLQHLCRHHISRLLM